MSLLNHYWQKLNENCVRQLYSGCAVRHQQSPCKEERRWLVLLNASAGRHVEDLIVLLNEASKPHLWDVVKEG